VKLNPVNSSWSMVASRLRSVLDSWTFSIVKSASKYRTSSADSYRDNRPTITNGR